MARPRALVALYFLRLTVGLHSHAKVAAVFMQRQADDLELDLELRERHVRVVVNVGKVDFNLLKQQAYMVKRSVGLPYELFASVSDETDKANFSRVWIAQSQRSPEYVVSHSDVLAQEKDLVDSCLLTTEEACDHGVQLHHLAEHACGGSAASSDVLLFLDADAWPLANLSEHVLPLMDGEDGVGLVAVRQGVEGISLWPHPSFAVTTCGAWDNRALSWSHSQSRVASGNQRDRLKADIFSASRGLLCDDSERGELDVGSPLWPVYNDTSRNWIALDRINRVDLHPTRYGLYGRAGTALAYSHGTRLRSQVTIVPDGKAADHVQKPIFDMLLQGGMPELNRVLLGKSVRPNLFLEGMPESAVQMLTEALFKSYEEMRKMLLESKAFLSACTSRAEGLCTLRPKLDFIHIPKTGGTSIEVWGLRQAPPVRLGRYRKHWPQGNCLWGCRSRTRKLARWQPCSAFHMPPAIFRQQGSPGYSSEATTMCVLRNPFDRVTSQVSWMLRKKAATDPSVCTAKALNAQVQKWLGPNAMRASIESVEKAFPNLLTAHMIRNESFCDRQESRADCQNRIAQPAFQEDCHWLPQWMYVEGECHHRLRTETLEHDFQSLLAKVSGKDIPFVSHELEILNKRNQQTCPMDASMLNAASEALIRQVYAKDFALYRYSSRVQHRTSSSAA